MTISTRITSIVTVIGLFAGPTTALCQPSGIRVGPTVGAWWFSDMLNRQWQQPEVASSAEERVWIRDYTPVGVTLEINPPGRNSRDGKAPDASRWFFSVGFERSSARMRSEACSTLPPPGCFSSLSDRDTRISTISAGFGLRPVASSSRIPELALHAVRQQVTSDFGYGDWGPQLANQGVDIGVRWNARLLERVSLCPNVRTAVLLVDRQLRRPPPGYNVYQEFGAWMFGIGAGVALAVVF